MNTLLIALVAAGGNLSGPAPAASVHAPLVAWDDLKDQVVEITEDYNNAYQDWLNGYRKATPEKREELMESMPDSSAVAEEVLDMVDGAPTSEAGFVASRWVIERVYEPGLKGRAFDIMTLHTQHPEFHKVAQRVRGGDAAANKFLETAMDAVDDVDAKGKICYRLATGCASMISRSTLSEQKEKETREAAEKYFALCMANYADVVLYPSRDGNPENDITIGGRVKHDLFELRNLTKGKVAPDIVGEDIDGVAFKLSDYRGKVVMLDFWGDW